MNDITKQNSGNPQRPRRIDPELENQVDQINLARNLKQYELVQQGQNQRLREVASKKMKKSILKKAFPYLLVGGSTGTGLGLALGNLFF